MTDHENDEPDPADAADAARRLDVRLLLPAGCAWIAVLVGLRLSPAVLLPTAVAAGFTALLLARRDLGSARSIAALCLAATSLTTLATGLHQATAQVGLVDELTAQRATVTVRASLATDPRLVSRRSDAAGADDPMYVLTLTVREVAGRGEQSGSGARVLVFGDEAWAEMRWGQTVLVTGRLSEPDPGAAETAVLAVFRPPRLVADAPAPFRAVEVLRERLREATDPLPADPRGLVPALVIGDTSRLPGDLVDDMRATGMTHLTAVSGANVSILLLAVVWCCGWLRIPRRGRLPVCLVALAAFVLLCRPEPSVVRASAMGVVGLLATSSGRPRAAAPALGAAVVGLLVIDPWLAASYGFALSVLATLGLVLFARSWGRRIAAALPRRLAWLGEPIAIPVAAQAMCAPVIVLLQSSVSVVGVPANLLAAPLVAPATLGGIAVVLLAPLSLPLGVAIAWVAGLPAWGIGAVAHLAARVPWGNLPWPAGPPGALLLAALVLLALLTGPRLVVRGRRHPVVVLACALLVSAAVWPLPQPGWPPPGWVLVVCDVGQGDAAVLRTGPDRALVVDAGPDEAAVGRCLDDLGVRRVEAVVLTHLHADHVTGLPTLLDGRGVGEVVTTPVRDEDSGAAEQPTVGPLVVRASAAAGVPLTEVRAGDRLSWGRVQATVLWPGRTVRTGSLQNNGSVVLDVRVAGVRLLLLGDAEQEAQRETRRALARLGDPTPVLAMKVAHHGSSNHDPALLRQVRATYGLISVGADNDYGHPAPRLLGSLRDAGTLAVRTDRGGDLAVVVRDGRGSVVSRR